MSKAKKLLALVMLAAMIFTAIPFTASAAFEYWGFDDYETIENPGAPEEITSYPTVVKKESDSVYTMTSTIEGVGTISISLIEETWGTFNLGNWILTTASGQKHTFVDASTDTEYVHHYHYSETETTISGGNHGGEALESLKFYDGESGEELNLATGQSKLVNVLHVIEKTNLLHFPDENNDSINDYINKNTPYTEDQIYAKLTRKYTFTGPQIKLNVDYLYTRDSYHGKIYTCMFPVSKKYSNYCDMIDKDGNIIRTIESRPYGDTSIDDYAGSQNQGNAATRAVVYSTDYPNYQFDIRINTFKDSLNEFKDATYKTSYWDMNKWANKLYFSRYDEGQRIFHERGKEVHTEQIWLFRYVEEGRQPALDNSETPISNNKTYTNDFNNGNGDDTSYGAKLTDGIAADSFDMGNDSWYLFYGNNVTNGKGVVVIDLESNCSISKVRAHLANVAGMAVKAPKSITVSGSTDNISFSNIASLTPQTGVDDIYWTEAKVPENTVARYIKFEFELTGVFAYANELEVYGDAIAGDNPIVTPPEETDFILGDVNESGAIDMMDYILLKRNYFGTFDFSDAQLKAGDCNKSGGIDMMDYILLKRAYFGTFELE